MSGRRGSDRFLLFDVVPALPYLRVRRKVNGTFENYNMRILGCQEEMA